MSRRRIIASLLAVGLVCPAVNAGDWFAEAMYVMKRDYRRNACWPKPFVAPARQAVAAPFYMMIDNGWRQQNLIADHHFLPDSAVLTEASKLKMRIILTQLPEARRVLFVQRGYTAEDTAARVEAVQAEARQIVQDGSLPMVLETSIAPVSTPAYIVEAVDSAWEETIPAPRIPEIDRSYLNGP